MKLRLYSRFTLDPSGRLRPVHRDLCVGFEAGGVEVGFRADQPALHRKPGRSGLYCETHMALHQHDPIDLVMWRQDETSCWHSCIRSQRQAGHSLVRPCRRRPVPDKGASGGNGTRISPLRVRLSAGSKCPSALHFKVQ